MPRRNTVRNKRWLGSGKEELTLFQRKARSQHICQLDRRVFLRNGLLLKTEQMM